MSILEDKISALADLVAGIDPEVKGPLDALQALQMIRETADSATGNAVALARSEGASWHDIGQMLGGISRQAAHERYSAAMRDELTSAAADYGSVRSKD
jgi:hypothetical protein